ncbi:MAG: catalytic domain of component of various dehydrogenase complexe, partial [Actinomycetia bacterium]|nr:catalytic domain of component of various dehydrogenase complexe [Actinomycetes bacterium]
MTTTTDANEVKVPDIGDFSGVPVIEIHVAVGDTVAPEDPLITLESDKATMDVPSPAEGVVQRLAVSVGDEVSEGDLILTLAGGDGAAQAGVAEDQQAADVQQQEPSP